jgi:hypothetical protein
LLVVSPDSCNEIALYVFLLDNKYAGPSKALPRCALPKYLIEELQKHIPNSIFVSNPCRFDMKLMLKIPIYQHYTNVEMYTLNTP